jgi:hypothetical protein
MGQFVILSESTSTYKHPRGVLHSLGIGGACDYISPFGRLLDREAPIPA